MTDSPFTCCTLDDVLARAMGKILVITPLYPSADNPYACAFVHTRVLAYRRAGLLVDVAVRAFDGITGCYQYEGVTVYKLSMNDLQALGQTYEHEDLLPETYGFGANFPNSTFALFKRSWLESMRQSFENDEAFDDTYASLVESAHTLSYLPLPAWHIRLAEPDPEPKNDGIDDGPNDVDNSAESDKPVHHRLRGLKSRLSRLAATKRTKS